MVAQTRKFSFPNARRGSPQERLHLAVRKCEARSCTMGAPPKGTCLYVCTQVYVCVHCRAYAQYQILEEKNTFSTLGPVSKMTFSYSSDLSPKMWGCGCAHRRTCPSRRSGRTNVLAHPWQQQQQQQSVLLLLQRERRVSKLTRGTDLEPNQSAGGSTKQKPKMFTSFLEPGDNDPPKAIQQQ